MTGSRAGQAGDDRPDDYKDLAKVRKLLDRARDDAKDNIARQARDRQDIWNLRMYRGGEENQWSAFNRATGRYEPIPYDGPNGIPEWIPRCTTNKFAVKIDDIAAILNGSSPAKVFVPMTADDADQSTAEVCEDADPVLLDEIGWDRLRRRLHQLIALTDKGAIVVYYDPHEKYGTQQIEMLQCLSCQQYTTPMEAGGEPTGALPADEDLDLAPDTGEGAVRCPSCGAGDLVTAQDPRTGELMGIDYPVGRMCAELWCSYEFSLPSSAKIADADEVPWVLGHQRMGVEEACSAWPKHAEAIRKQVGQAGSSTAAETATAHQYAEEMRNLSSPRAVGGMGALHDKAAGVMVYRLLQEPIEDDDVKFSQGLHCVAIGDLIVETEALPLQDATGCRRKNVLIRQFSDTPNTPHGKPPADDLNPLQRQRNRYETLNYLTLLTHASPQVFLPDTVELIDEISMIPGNPVRFRTTQPGDRPYIQPGVAPPESIYRAIELTDAAMEEVSHLNSVLGGQRPEGDPTLGEVQILQERGMAAFSTPMAHLIECERRLSRMLIDMARQTAWAPRFRKVRGENGQWDVRQFTAADLKGAIDITIEPLTAWPKSPAMEMIKLQKAIEMGVLVPGQDPEVASKILATLGLSHMKPSLDADRKQVARELDRWKGAVSPSEIEPPNFAVIEKPVHLFLKKQFLKSEIAETIRYENRAVYDAMVAHVQQIELALMPAATDAAPPKPDGSVIDSAVQAGAIAPAGAQPTGPSPLDAAIASRALVPAGAMETGPTGPSMDELLERGVLTPAPPEQGVHAP